MNRPTLLAEMPTITQVRAAIARVREAGSALALATAQEAQLLREKPGRKMAAIRRLMATENPLIAGGKAYTCSAAEAVAETDPGFYAFGQQLTNATCQRELARVEVVAARLEAQLELAIILADEDPSED